MRKQDTITVTAPGKIHLMGEHAVVYGKPALLAAIDMRCTVQLTPTENDSITITVQDLKKTKKYLPEEILIVTKATDTIMEAVDIPAIAIGETITCLQERLPSGFTLTITSEIPVGSGLGSSAAISVAVAAAIMVFLTKKIDTQAVNEIAFNVEKRIHGNPSGGDNTICCYGGTILFQKGKKQSAVAIAKKMTGNFFLIDSGRPVETTGEMVTKVKSHMSKVTSKERIFDIFDEQEQITNDMVQVLKKGNEEQLMDLIKRGKRNLEKIGVVSALAKSLIAMIEKEGGAAKICGAGGREKGSGMLLVYHPDRKKMEQVFLKKKLTFYAIILGTKGVIIQ
jgi:mevalonate kinase